MAIPQLHFDDSYARALPEAGLDWPAAPVVRPQLVFFNTALADELGLGADLAQCTPAELAALFAGQQLPAGTNTRALAYAGHQFGHFVPQLGDGRALLIGELIDRQGQRQDLAFKGSGATPFARGGDGLAALGPMLREALMGEAMHALGIPTSRALAVVATGTLVQRERPLPGALLTRVASSHLRVGSFQYFAARQNLDALRRLADYAIARHMPQLQTAARPYLAFLQAVVARQARLIADWQCVGFIHGVMNTDNMSIAGQTLDYGPCAFMESHDPQTVYSSIDHHGRYAYGNQPACARWNLARLAEALLPLLAAESHACAAASGKSPDEAASREQALALATAAIADFDTLFEQALQARWRAKLGLAVDERWPAAEASARTGHDDCAGPAQPGTPGAQAEHSEQAEHYTHCAQLSADWLQLLQHQRVDFTQAWRALSQAALGEKQPLQALFADQPALSAWLARWQAHCQRADAAAGKPAGLARRQRAQAMQAVNPWLIARNQAVEAALTAATEAQDLAPFERLLAALRQPYDAAAEQQGAAAAFARPSAADFMAGYQTFCGT